jgi:tRNA A37 threonylcarbamoyladenosine dehydratase
LLPPDLHQEQLSRNSLFFSKEGMAAIRGATVVVVGLGGVGSHAAHMIARSGVGRLILIDFDQVTLSSTNRHATATLADVGIPKVQSVANLLKKVTPNCEVIALAEMFTAESAAAQLDGYGKIAFVVDAIDDVPTKAHLIKSCVDRNVPFISSMGAACKSDPTRLHIGDLRSCIKDPLCTKLRWYLNKMNVDPNHELIKILFSSEKPTAKLATLSAEQISNPGEFGSVDNMRIRVLPVLGTMPAIMGQACASFVVCEIGGKAFAPVEAERLGKQIRHRLLQHVKNRETDAQKRADAGEEGTEGWVTGVEIDADDVEYLMSELWRNRCYISGDRLGAQLELIKWDMGKAAAVDNLVLMSAKGLAKFKKVGKEGLDGETVERIERRLGVAKQLMEGIEEFV